MGQGSGTSIQGNDIGTDLTGLLAIPNGQTDLMGYSGISLTGVQSVSIGGTTSGAGNVISGNHGYGVFITNQGTTQPTQPSIFIQGNDIGVGSDGMTQLGNDLTGVFITSASYVTVGGTLAAGDPQNPGYANIIAFNGFLSTLTTPGPYGVEISGGSHDAILTNSIYNNFSLGIRLNTLTDNQSITPPTLNSVQYDSTSGKTQITGSYAGRANTTYRIQFFANLMPNASGAGDGQTFLGDYDLTTDGNGKANFSTQLAAGNIVTEEVSATATQAPNAVVPVNNTSQFSKNVMAVQASMSDLIVTTSPDSTTGIPLLGQPFTFTITVKNNGPMDTTNVVLTDTIPTNSSLDSSSPNFTTQGGQVLTYLLGSLASMQSVTVTITVTPNDVRPPFTNVATAFSDSFDPIIANNTSTTSWSVTSPANLGVTLTAEPPSAVTQTALNSPVTFYLNVFNIGSGTANNTTETVSLPASFTNILVNPDQGSYSVNSLNNVTINTGILPAGFSSSIVITATPLALGQQDVTATVSNVGTSDPDPTNNTAMASVNVVPASDLGLSVTANPEPVMVGQDLIYTIVVTNYGPSIASDPVLTDTLPANVTFDPTLSAAGQGGMFSDVVNGVLTATLAPIAVGGSQTVTIAVIPLVPSQIFNSVTVTDTNEIDTDTTNNTVVTPTQVSPADVGVTVQNPSDPLFIGTQAVYVIQVTNYGPYTATNVNLIDTVGPGATIVGASAGFVSGNTVNIAIGSLDVGATETFTVTVNPTASVTLSNSATVTDQYDPDPNNNTSSTSNLVSPVDLAVAVTGSPNPTLTGYPLTYVVTVTNNGPAVATNVLFNNLLPAGSIFGSVTTTQGSVSLTNSSTLSGNLGNLAPGASATVTIVVTPTVVATTVDTAAVTSDNLDTNSSNNSASASVSVINQPGVIQFGSSLIYVPENAGSVTLTLTRTNGSQGTVTVDYATSDYTAVAGVNYVASSGTVTFLDGQLTATITISVLDDMVVNGDNGFFVTLSNPTGGATLGAPTSTR